jgi:hypothetical protein
MRILVPHVDYCGANFNLSRFGANRRKQWKRGCQLLCEVMDTEISSVHLQALGLHGEVNGLQECVSRRPRS